MARLKSCPSRSVFQDVLRTRLSAFGAGGVAEGIALGVDFAAEVFEDVVGHLQKNLDDLGIELAAGPCLDFFAGFGESSGGTVGAIGDDGVESIGDGEDARAQRNFGAPEAARIAGTIEMLLVRVNNVAS